MASEAKPSRSRHGFASLFSPNHAPPGIARLPPGLLVFPARACPWNVSRKAKGKLGVPRGAGPWSVTRWGGPRSQVLLGNALVSEAPLRDCSGGEGSPRHARKCKAPLCPQALSQVKLGNEGEEAKGKPGGPGRRNRRTSVQAPPFPARPSHRCSSLFIGGSLPSSSEDPSAPRHSFVYSVTAASSNTASMIVVRPLVV